MTTIGAQLAPGIDLSQIRRLDISPLSVRKASPEQMERLRKFEEMRYTRPVNLQDHPSQKIYAEVMVNGKSVATLYNSGAMMTSNAGYGRLSRLPSVADPQGSGPMLTQQRAEEIAKALGGTVVMRPDALTQAQWHKVPPVRFAIDYAAMERDRKAAETRSASAAALVQAQVIAQRKDAAADTGGVI